MCRWLFQGFTEIQNSRHGLNSIFWCVLKHKKIFGSFYFYFNITFLATCGYANDFFKMLSKFKMAAKSQLQIFFERENLTSEIFQILQSHSPRYGDVQIYFLRFCWNSKWPPRINLNFFEVTKTQKNNVYNHIPHDMEMCMWCFLGFTEIQNGRHAWTHWSQK